jgi:hypothetical protein
MAIFLNNEDQEKSITPESAMDALAHGIRQLAEGNALRRAAAAKMERGKERRDERVRRGCSFAVNKRAS